MQGLYNKDRELIAYHHQNMILHPDSLHVRALVLGNCVFDAEANIIGKLFQQTIYKLSGEILASQSPEGLSVPDNFNFNDSLAQAWQILVVIKDHDTPWVEPSKKWSRTSLKLLL